MAISFKVLSAGWSNLWASCNPGNKKILLPKPRGFILQMNWLFLHFTTYGRETRQKQMNTTKEHIITQYFISNNTVPE
jgi:hypothetical protein